MKNIFVLFFLSIILLGCNPNPNKEARIQKLEFEIEQTMGELESH